MNYFKQLQKNYPIIAEYFDELTGYDDRIFIEIVNRNPDLELPDEIKLKQNNLNSTDSKQFYAAVLLYCADEFSKIIKEIDFKHKLCIGKDEEIPGRVCQAVVYVEDDKQNRKLFELMKLQDEIIKNISDDDKLKEILIESQHKLKTSTNLYEEEAKFNKIIDLIVEYSNHSVLFSNPGDYKTGTDFEDSSLRFVEHELDCDNHEECQYCFCKDGFPCTDVCCVGTKYKKQPKVNSLFHKYIYHNWMCDVYPIVAFINKCNGFETDMNFY